MSQRIVFSHDKMQKFVFMDESNASSGLVVKLEYELQQCGSVVTHLHPGSSRYFGVIEGQLAFAVEGKKEVFKSGQRVQMPHGGRHSRWNPGKAVVRY